MIKLRALGGTIIELSKKQPLFVRHLSIFFVFQEPQKFRHPARKKNFWRELATGSSKKLLLGTGLWYHAKMSTSLKSPDGLKDAECKKGQLSHRPPILYVPVVDIVMPKEDPQVFKIKLPDASHLRMPIYSHGNNEEYLAHIVAVL
jgi:hypothetical protein